IILPEEIPYKSPKTFQWCCYTQKNISFNSPIITERHVQYPCKSKNKISNHGTIIIPTFIINEFFPKKTISWRRFGVKKTPIHLYIPNKGVGKAEKEITVICMKQDFL